MGFYARKERKGYSLSLEGRGSGRGIFKNSPLPLISITYQRVDFGLGKVMLGLGAVCE